MDRPNLATTLDFTFRISPRRLAYLAAATVPFLVCTAVGDSDLQSKATVLLVVWTFGVFVWVVESCRRFEVRDAALRQLQTAIDEAVFEDELRRIHERFDQLRGRPTKGPWAIHDVRVFPVGDELEERRQRRASQC